MHSIYWEKKKGYVLVHAEKTYVSMEEHKTLRNKTSMKLFASSLWNFVALKETQVQVEIWKQ